MNRFYGILQVQYDSVHKCMVIRWTVVCDSLWIIWFFFFLNLDSNYFPLLVQDFSLNNWCPLARFWFQTLNADERLSKTIKNNYLMKFIWFLISWVLADLLCPRYRRFLLPRKKKKKKCPINFSSCHCPHKTTTLSQILSISNSRYIS